MPFTAKSLAAAAETHILGFYQNDIEALKQDVSAAGGPQHLVASGRFFRRSDEVVDWWKSVGYDTEMGPRCMWVLYYHVITDAICRILREE